MNVKARLAGIGLIAAAVCGAAQAAPPAAPGGPLLSSMLRGPLADAEQIVFAVRVSGRDHWYVNFGYYSCDYGPGPERGWGRYPDDPRVYRGFPKGGARLCRLNLRTGELTVLLDDPDGGIRDPQVHYDGRKILFSYRPGGECVYHLYEINADGTGLRQLTDGPDDDIEPTYLPDGGIMFCSARCRRFVNCWYSRVTTLHRCDADGSNIRMVSSNNDHDNTPWVLPDGRVLYMRWEYVDRSQVHFHHLWTVKPDGTDQMVYYGNEFGGTVMLDAKPIPGTNKVVASFSPGHGRPEHVGHVAIVDPAAGPDVKAAARQVSKGAPVYRDPYALSEDCFLVASKHDVLVMDGQGRTEVVYRLPPEDIAYGLECHEPRPLRPRPREPVVPQEADLTQATAQVVLADVYTGRNMEGVQRGEIKKLLVLEQLPEPVHFSGGMEPLTIGGTFTMARIVGVAPVEPDGSAFMELPALRSLFFVALDENDLSVKRMQSFVTFQPGERAGCVGCHEQRSRTTLPPRPLMALQRPPSAPEPIADAPDVFDFPRDIQPILDKHCVACHNPDRREGNVELVGDHTPRYSVSYWTLTKRRLLADGRNQPFGNRPPRTIGSSASRLMQLIDGSHYGARLSEHERKMVRLWIETSATYPGTYAALGSGMYPVRLPVGVLLDRCASCHKSLGARDAKNRPSPAIEGWPLQAMCNLTRPDKSILLRAPLAKTAGGLGRCGERVFRSASDPGYQALLASIQRAAGELARGKRFDMPGFRPNEHYIRELQRFGVLPKDLGPDDPVDYYAADRAYWRSFWYDPARRLRETWLQDAASP